MKQKLKMVSLKVEPRQTENLKTIANIKKESQSELLRNWIDKELEKNILDIVSEAGRTIQIEASQYDDYTTIETEFEHADLMFNLSIEVGHEYYPPDYESDMGYQFETLTYKVTLISIEDENGIIQMNNRLIKQIEKGFNKNLTFDIFKKN